jgi:hypothetical protein
MRLFALLFLALVLALSCEAKTPSGASAPIPSATENDTMAAKLLLDTVKLTLPYFPWADAYASVRGDADLGKFLDSRVIPALEGPGEPAARLRAMAAAVQQARMAFAASGRAPNLSFNGMDPVETDLREAFFVALSAKVAGHVETRKEARLAALQALLALVRSDEPVGVPAPKDSQPWNATARITAETEIEVHIEKLQGGG